ncbi:uncharacterized protein FFB20_04257 [Fusarium fujikuroi]|uniref:Uncharacterized protein n=2 Tax=Fusarium fujikuroi TaxID=5127 RepID=S0DJM4_GIBF5|nr:uncharacterized protein FFUJ_00657 [Fusarium fujikuroi IMI 58289]SCN66870.1 uncharacterized protein FFE2_00721 [Fusarium fujikuroi]CCT62759.1 uncharacterized protein FFUJ_00657 [Fusarium fujikuroi IMI 58289]SCN69923.1 uncharacterized protein FFC1_00718 [Fusarium fujikuroi]SCN72891.1 uncharacterized protein FFB20_04257 [Fusarium fujikuroi]SCN73469.1 uncharacterized protein FFM5_00679 [Fusarium fujikuroi]
MAARVIQPHFTQKRSQTALVERMRGSDSIAASRIAGTRRRRKIHCEPLGDMHQLQRPGLQSSDGKDLSHGAVSESGCRECNQRERGC